MFAIADAVTKSTRISLILFFSRIINLTIKKEEFEGVVVKLTLLCKQKALYVKCCIIQNGVEDFHGDVLDATDIKKIFTSFNNQDSFEIYHEEIPIQEVSLLENYISQTDEIIAGTNVPKGSWNAVIRVDNPSVKQQLLNGDFGGVSLNNRVQTSCSTGLVGNITYSDLRDAECVIPVYISFVEQGANLVGLHIMNYDVYIQKSKNDGGKDMSLIEDLKALIKKAEEEVEDAETPTETETAEEPVEEEPPEEVKKEATEEKEEEAVEEDEAVEEETTAEGEEATETPTEEETEVSEEISETKEEDDDEEIKKEAEEIIVEEEQVSFDAEAEIQTLKEEIAELKAIVEELLPKNPIDEEAVVEDTANEPIITKSAKIEVTSTDPVDAIDDFYARTGRDKVTGMKIREPRKILN